jgi:SAM-dependent methyltransferase
MTTLCHGLSVMVPQVSTVEAQLARLDIPRDAMLSLIAPYVKEVWDESDPCAREAIRQRRKGLVHLVLRNLVKQLKDGKRSRTGQMVSEFYEEAYSNRTFSGYAVGTRYVTYLLGDKVVKLTGMGNYRAKSRAIERVFDIVKPQSVCEAGCGRMKNLAYFATIFPDIRFSGFDISHNAIDTSRSLQQLDTLDLHLPERSDPLSREEMERVRRIDLFQGNAANLNGIPDKTFDITYTISALEQMHSILPDVLRELRRITRGYVVFCEPFRDVNGTLERIYLWSDNYFRADVAFVERHGFRCINLLDCLPHKPTFKDAVLIAEVVH